VVSSTSAIELRSGDVSDLPGILALQQHSGGAFSEQFRDVTEGAILDPERCFVVACIQGALVGWATTRYFAEADGAAPAGHYLMGIRVDLTHRRRGVAHALIGARVDWIRERADNAYYFTNARNSASMAAHRRWSFVEIARAPEFRGVTFEGGEGALFGAYLVR
jgi:aminoglycoside 6'-N-acetyltransferase I